MIGTFPSPLFSPLFAPLQKMQVLQHPSPFSPGNFPIIERFKYLSFLPSSSRRASLLKRPICWHLVRGCLHVTQREQRPGPRPPLVGRAIFFLPAPRSVEGATKTDTRRGSKGLPWRWERARPVHRCESYAPLLRSRRGRSSPRSSRAGDNGEGYQPRTSGGRGTKRVRTCQDSRIAGNGILSASRVRKGEKASALPRVERQRKNSQRLAIPQIDRLIEGPRDSISI